MNETTALAIVPKDQLPEKSGELEYSSLMALAKDLCATGFLPTAVKTPAQAVAIILTGRELGLGPMQSLRSICIIQGKPELAADLQLSIFHRDGGRSKWLALTEAKAILWLRHPNGDEHTETFTMQDAQRADLARGTNWQKYPKAMLRSRAITAGLKSIGFEPLSGAYAPGEIGGPEIVGPEPETVPETDETSQNAPGRATPPSRHTPPAQNASQTPLRQSAPAQKPSSSEKRYATPESRQKLIAMLEPQRDLATEYFRKLDNPAVLLPNETLEDLGLQFVPLTQKQAKALNDAITDFGNGAEALHAFPANELSPEEQTKRASKAKPTAPAPEAGSKKPPPQVAAAKEKDPEWWRDVICPIPFKGMKRDDYMKKPQTVGQLYDSRHDEEMRRRLYGFIGHFEVKKTWTDNQGQERARRENEIETDQLFRDALDACAEYAEKHHGDTEHGQGDFGF